MKKFYRYVVDHPKKIMATALMSLLFSYNIVPALASNDPIQQQGDTITFSSDDKKVYYQGTLDQAQIPKANVANFEMSEVSVNGIKLNLNLEIDDKKLMGKVREFMNATKQPYQGINRVYEGSDKLNQLTTSSSTMKQGISQLYAGIMKLQENISFAQYKDAMAANGLDINTVKAGNIDAIQTLTSQIDSHRDSIARMENMPGYEIQVSELKGQVESLQRIMLLLTGSNAVIAGTESYLNELSSSVSSLSEGAASLQNNYETFDQATVRLANTLSGLTVKVSKLTEGVNQLVTSY